jgi:antitoxin component of MazEF toxin-antitoxin module
LELLEMLHGDTAVPVGNYQPIQSGHSLGVRVPSETATMLKLKDCWKVETAVNLSHNLIAGHVLMAEDDDTAGSPSVRRNQHHSFGR